jgi:hypothetical protein
MVPSPTRPEGVAVRAGAATGASSKATSCVKEAQRTQRIITNDVPSTNAARDHDRRLWGFFISLSPRRLLPVFSLGDSNREPSPGPYSAVGRGTPGAVPSRCPSPQLLDQTTVHFGSGCSPPFTDYRSCDRSVRSEYEPDDVPRDTNAPQLAPTS